jgi:hypothetical protein
MFLSRIEPPQEATIALGQYITEWGHLERLIDALFLHLPPQASERAQFAFHRLSIQLKTECVIDLLSATTDGLKIDTPLQLQLSETVEKCQKQIKHRNRIVHSIWGNLSPLGKANWCRIYYHSILEPYDRFVRTKPNDQKFRDANIYAVDRISRLHIETRELSDRLTELLYRLGEVTFMPLREHR